MREEPVVGVVPTEGERFRSIGTVRKVPLNAFTALRA
jgi:hypothetical protein